MIDTHTHLGQLRFDDPGMTPSTMLRWMDRNKIDQAVVMAVEVPEELDYFVTTRELLKMTRRHRDRLHPLCAVDPRHRYPGKFDPYPIIEDYMSQGCVGYGENLCGLPVDDPMQQRVYEACDRLGISITMHLDWWINRDKPGLPNFEKMVKTYSRVKWVGHAQYFWREISAKVPRKESYPKGPGSGYNAITRDPEFGRAFLKRWKSRLMFATDKLRKNQDASIIEHIRTVDVGRDAFDRITRENAEKVFGLR